MIYIFSCLSLLLSGALSACSWTVTTTDGTKRKLDLSKLSGNVYSAIGIDNSNYEYNVSICANDLLCPDDAGTNPVYMVTQQYIPEPTLCYYAGAFDDGVSPVFSGGNNKYNASWKFTYANGESTGGCSITGRTAILNFYCAATLSKKDPPTTIAYEAQECTYEIDIYTPYACEGSSGGGGGGSNNNNDLSGGSIFLIIILCLFVCYCLVGYIWNKVRNPENGWGDVTKNTPNYQFWCLLPKYVMTGCMVTKEKLTGGGDSGHEQILDTENDE